MDGKRRWNYVATGLRLKLAALWLLLACPVAFVAAYLYELPPVGPAVIVFGLAVALDVTGRCLCLVAPVPHRFALVASVICQTAALVAVATGWVLGGTTELIATAFVAVALQWGVANWFTLFLADVAVLLDRPDLEARIRRLHRSIHTAALAGGTSFATSALIAVAALNVGFFAFLILGCFALLLVIPIAIALAVLAVFVALAFGYMWSHYGTSLGEVRRAVVNRARRAGELPQARALREPTPGRTPETPNPWADEPAEGHAP